MDLEEIMAYCAAKKGAEHLYKPEWEADLYRLAEKMFVMIGGDREGTPIVSLKSEPEEAIRLREKYPAIIPGYYLNKQQWNSVYYHDPSIPAELVKKMIDDSYELVLAKLPKRTQAEIRG